MMDKIWFIAYNYQPEGPYSVSDLKKDLRVTPDTFVWKEGFDAWKKISEVPELKVVFQEEKESQNDESAEEKKIAAPQDELVLELGRPPSIFWIFIAIIIVAYLVGQLFWR